MAEKTQVLRIKRQESPNSESYYEEFEIPYLAQSQHHLDADGDTAQPGDAAGQARGAGGVRRQLSRGSLRIVHDGDQRARAAGMLATGRGSQRAGDGRADVEVSGDSGFVGRSIEDVRGAEEGARVDSDRRHLRPRRGAANGAERAGVRVPVLAMHDVRMLPRGVPAGKYAFEVHGRGGHRAGLPDEPASRPAR